MTKRASTATIAQAMRILAQDIQSEDGVANAAIAEAAQRLEELHAAMLTTDEIVVLRKAANVLRRLCGAARAHRRRL